MKKDKKKFLGIELPFGWCLIRLRELKHLQESERENRFKSQMRLTTIARLYKRILKS